MLPVLRVSALNKSFVMHAQGDLALPVLQDVALAVCAGRVPGAGRPLRRGQEHPAALALRQLPATVRLDPVRHRDAQGQRWVELVGAEPRVTLDVRRHTIGFVSQFLRVIPRVGAVDVVAEPMVRRGAPLDEARRRAEFLLGLLGIPARLWTLPPATFSGGEQQRVNIARSLIADYPILLLDEPTASLDTANRDGVIDLIRQRREAGTAIVGIFHDVAVRETLATRLHTVALPGAQP